MADSKVNADVAQMSYEQARDELAKVLADLEAGSVTLEQSMTMWERGEALAKRAGGGLDTRCHADFRVTRRLAVHLAEVAQLAHRQVIAHEVQHRIQQHRSVAVAQHEAVAIGPVRVARVVLEVTAPQRHGHFGHAHGRTRMA
jgi:exodeoxyribonuclease VII small subunit